MAKGNRAPCAHCGAETAYAWVDTRTPADSPIHLCVECMNRAVVVRPGSEGLTSDKLLRPVALKVIWPPRPRK
jgi:hypothetical protein